MYGVGLRELLQLPASTWHCPANRGTQVVQVGPLGPRIGHIQEYCNIVAKFTGPRRANNFADMPDSLIDKMHVLLRLRFLFSRASYIVINAIRCFRNKHRAELKTNAAFRSIYARFRALGGGHIRGGIS